MGTTKDQDVSVHNLAELILAYLFYISNPRAQVHFHKFVRHGRNHLEIMAVESHSKRYIWTTMIKDPAGKVGEFSRKVD